MSENNEHNQNEEPENHDRWLVSYADFITLLFAFFVVMYATSNNNPEKQKSFQDTVRVNLKLSGSGPGSGETQHDGQTTEPNTIDSVINLEGFPKNKGPGETQDYLTRYLEKKVSAEDKDKVQALRIDPLGVRIELASGKFFNPGGTKIKIGSLKFLDQIAELLSQSDRRIVIEGHTDNQPISKDATYESNWELGALRATSIVRYLQKYHKIDPSRLSATSFGDTKPLKSNDSEEGRSQNRRIEIYLVLDDRSQ
ncbi:MAG: OmpA family protein [Bdellovibrio sp.]|nr:OmpA family protein [Bdellovibrio sp.]